MVARALEHSSLKVLGLALNSSSLGGPITAAHVPSQNFSSMIVPPVKQGHASPVVELSSCLDAAAAGLALWRLAAAASVMTVAGIRARRQFQPEESTAAARAFAVRCVWCVPGSVMNRSVATQPWVVAPKNLGALRAGGTTTSRSANQKRRPKPSGSRAASTTPEAMSGKPCTQPSFHPPCECILCRKLGLEASPLNSAYVSTYEIVQTFPHETDAFTQGLTFDEHGSLSRAMGSMAAPVCGMLCTVGQEQETSRTNARCVTRAL